jgi:hypothetical protein
MRDEINGGPLLSDGTPGGLRDLGRRTGIEVDSTQHEAGRSGQTYAVAGAAPVQSFTLPGDTALRRWQAAKDFAGMWNSTTTRDDAAGYWGLSGVNSNSVAVGLGSIMKLNINRKDLGTDTVGSGENIFERPQLQPFLDRIPTLDPNDGPVIDDASKQSAPDDSWQVRPGADVAVPSDTSPAPAPARLPGASDRHSFLPPLGDPAADPVTIAQGGGAQAAAFLAGAGPANPVTVNLARMRTPADIESALGVVASALPQDGVPADHATRLAAGALALDPQDAAGTIGAARSPAELAAMHLMLDSAGAQLLGHAAAAADPETATDEDAARFAGAFATVRAMQQHFEDRAA